MAHQQATQELNEDAQPAAAQWRPIVLQNPLPRRNAESHDRDMRDLLAALDNVLPEARSGKVVMFCSARPGEGKTTAIAELALRLSRQSRTRIAIVDAGTRHEIAGCFRDVKATPLKRFLQSLKKSARSAGGPTSDAFVVVTSDDSESSPRSLLREPDTWSALRSAYDYVLVETAALCDSSLALSCSASMDGVVLVIEAGRTRWRVVQNAQRQLEDAGAHVLGAFLNKRVLHIPRALYGWL
jgi:Mrp family chromosome partitioning ATPase